MSTQQEKVRKKIDSFVNNYTNKTVFGFSGDKKVDRKVGDTWVDDDGHEWEQKEGYKSKIRKIDISDMIMPNVCPVCNELFKSRHDVKMWNIHKMCINCVASMETKLRIEGKYDEYERNKIKENFRSYILDMEVQYNDFLEKSKDGMTFVNVVNKELASVDYEKWKISEDELVKIKEFYENQIEGLKKEYKNYSGEEYDKVV